MAHVFDRDPVIADIKAQAEPHHRKTQEFLMTQIIQRCVQYTDIRAVEVYPRNVPVDQGIVLVGLRLGLAKNGLDLLRAKQ